MKFKLTLLLIGLCIGSLANPILSSFAVSSSADQAIVCVNKKTGAMSSKLKKTCKKTEKQVTLLKSSALTNFSEPKVAWFDENGEEVQLLTTSEALGPRLGVIIENSAGNLATLEIDRKMGYSYFQDALYLDSNCSNPEYIFDVNDYYYENNNVLNLNFLFVVNYGGVPSYISQVSNQSYLPAHTPGLYALRESWVGNSDIYSWTCYPVDFSRTTMVKSIIDVEPLPEINFPLHSEIVYN